MLSKLARFVLFGNYYLAFCIVALAAETCLKNSFFITDKAFYLLIFFSVIVYYTHAYAGGNNAAQLSNARSLWYAHNLFLIRVTQSLFTVAVASISVYFFRQYHSPLSSFNMIGWVLLVLFPFIALLYYGIVFPARFRFRLRNIAWLKPFVIGFVCTGIIVVYPLLFHSLQLHQTFRLSVANILYFFTNWLFTTAIAIMFDIKDFTADHNCRLKTFVVTKGLRYTIFFILLPLAIASFVFFLLFAMLRHFSVPQILINTMPFLLLFAAAASLRRRKGILYYLVVIDGLLLLKAAFGIAVMIWIK